MPVPSNGGRAVERSHPINLSDIAANIISRHEQWVARKLHKQTVLLDGKPVDIHMIEVVVAADKLHAMIRHALAEAYTAGRLDGHDMRDH